jgi:hypothetical protein
MRPYRAATVLNEALAREGDWPMAETMGLLDL